MASDQLSAQPHNCRSYIENKSSHNIEQHLYGFDFNWDWTWDPKESLHSICDVNISTVLTRYPKVNQFKTLIFAQSDLSAIYLWDKFERVWEYSQLVWDWCITLIFILQFLYTDLTHQFRCNFYRKDRCITPKWCVKSVYEKSVWHTNLNINWVSEYISIQNIRLRRINDVFHQKEKMHSGQNIRKNGRNSKSRLFGVIWGQGFRIC
jgi:hypothetical protein